MSTDSREVICIVCPVGCRIQIARSHEEESGYRVTGHTCKRGTEYAIKEVTNPTRTLTSTVKVKNGKLERLPVRTNGEIPKSKIFSCMDIINKAVIEAPVRVGQVLVKDIFGTGVDIIASRTIEKE
jgi:CxxC motif-containing protein